MARRLCVIYEIEDYYNYGPPNAYEPTREKAIEKAQEENCRVYKVNVVGKGGIRKAICRMAEQNGWQKDRTLIEDFRIHENGHVASTP